MGLGCGCAAVLSTRSRVPLKRYNNLTSAIFPRLKQLPDEVDPVTHAPSKNTFKKIGTLMEYAEKNPHRIPKIARRLERRAVREMAQTALRAGYVHIAVAAFLELTTTCSQNISLFALHIFRLTDLLLQHGAEEFQMLGVVLLTSFWRHESDGTYMNQLDKFVVPLHDLAVRQQAQSPRSIQAHAHVLASLREYVRWMARTGFLSEHLDSIIWAVLTNLDHTWDEAEGNPLKNNADSALALEDVALDEASQAVAAAAGAANGRATRGVSSICHVTQLHSLHAHVLMVLSEVARLPKDAATARRVLDPILHHMDANSWWTRRDGLVQRTLEAVYSVLQDSHQGHILINYLVRQTSTAETVDASLAVVTSLRLLMRSSGVLDGTMHESTRRIGTSAVVTIHLLASKYACTRTDTAPGDKLKEAIAECVEMVARTVGEASQMAEVMGGVLEKMNDSDPDVVLAMLHCLAAVVRVAAEQNSRSVCFVGDKFPQGLLLGLVPLLAKPEEAVCCKAHSMLHSLFRGEGVALLRVPSQVMPSISSRSSFKSERVAGVFSDSQTSLVLSALWTRCSAGHLTPALAAAMCTTFQMVLVNCDKGGTTLLKAVPLAFRLQSLGAAAEGEGEEEDSAEVDESRASQPSRKSREGSAQYSAHDAALLTQMSTSMVACVGQIWGSAEVVKMANEQALVWGHTTSPWEDTIAGLFPEKARAQSGPDPSSNLVGDGDGNHVRAYTAQMVATALSRIPSLSTAHGGARRLRTDLQKTYKPVKMASHWDAVPRKSNSNAVLYREVSLPSPMQPLPETAADTPALSTRTQKVPTAWELLHSVPRDSASPKAVTLLQSAKDAPSFKEIMKQNSGIDVAVDLVLRLSGDQQMNRVLQ
eukprot:CAMPEP_0114282290 /NCGR_PEP_ID=MMETSP0059-20121206/3478_1 /TAXON_ID=36894 /ORGANISM="Pyramimonas parkeae, Strain CCMP726" /LENGTH=875 /DNA_ID=CAMNT_0001402919 /DNA_START=89 /DNA_END=2716 /DNA_ORIENTATION=+